MINHPAMPDIQPQSCMGGWENTSLIKVIAGIKQEGAELAFLSLVKWLEEPCIEHTYKGEYGLDNPKHRRSCSKCWKSLLKLVGPLEGQGEKE